MNWIIEHRKELEDRNYILKCHSGWIGLSENKIKSYFSSYDSNFNIILIGNEADKDDYYVIPYSFLKNYLTPKKSCKKR